MGECAWCGRPAVKSVPLSGVGELQICDKVECNRAYEHSTGGAELVRPTLGGRQASRKTQPAAESRDKPNRTEFGYVIYKDVQKVGAWRRNVTCRTCTSDGSPVCVVERPQRTNRIWIWGLLAIVIGPIPFGVALGVLAWSDRLNPNRFDPDTTWGVLVAGGVVSMLVAMCLGYIARIRIPFRHIVFQNDDGGDATLGQLLRKSLQRYEFQTADGRCLFTITRTATAMRPFFRTQYCVAAPDGNALLRVRRVFPTSKSPWLLYDGAGKLLLGEFNRMCPERSDSWSPPLEMLNHLEITSFGRDLVDTNVALCLLLIVACNDWKATARSDVSRLATSILWLPFMLLALASGGLLLIGDDGGVSRFTAFTLLALASGGLLLVWPRRLRPRPMDLFR